jgi:hypothetical protein
MSAIGITLYDILTIKICIEVLQEGSEVMTCTTLVALVIQIVLPAIEVSSRLALITL